MDPFIYQTDNKSIQRISAEEVLPGLATSLSANGCYLLFGERSNNPEPAADHYNFAYLRDLKTGQDELIDFTPLEKQLSVSGIWASLSPDGHFLALEVISDHWSIYLLERPTGKIIPVSVNPDGQFTDADSYEPFFSPDGGYLAFVSSASKLVAGDKPCSETNLNCGDVLIYEIATGRLERIPAQLRFTMGNPYPYLTISEKAHWLAWTELEEPSPSFHPVVRLFDRTTGKMENGLCWGGAILYRAFSLDLNRWALVGFLDRSSDGCLRSVLSGYLCPGLSAESPDRPINPGERRFVRHSGERRKRDHFSPTRGLFKRCACLG